MVHLLYPYSAYIFDSVCTVYVFLSHSEFFRQQDDDNVMKGMWKKERSTKKEVIAEALINYQYLCKQLWQLYHLDSGINIKTIDRAFSGL